ncbi:hypothetical protein IL306_006732 [Fusarium sp. DS 682]|nr:hypothetical protein IL306_006732 [Fusarium sp. DS 682]
MPYIADTLLDLYARVQNLVDRSRRSWLAAREAWNEELPFQSTANSTATEVLVLNKATRKQKRKEAKNNISHYQLGSSIGIFIKPSAEAIARAEIVADMSSDGSRMIFWTDASRTKLSKGCAAVFRIDSNWIRITTRGHTTPTDIAELEAVNLALDYAAQVTRMQEKSDDLLQSLEVFTDSQAALHLLRVKKLPVTTGSHSNGQGSNPYSRKQIRKRAVEKAWLRLDELKEAGVAIELHWVPRGKVTGNVIADKGATLARMGLSQYISNDALIEFLPADEEVSGEWGMPG